MRRDAAALDHPFSLAFAHASAATIPSDHPRCQTRFVPTRTRCWRSARRAASPARRAGALPARLGVAPSPVERRTAWTRFARGSSNGRRRAPAISSRISSACSAKRRQPSASRTSRSPPSRRRSPVVRKTGERWWEPELLRLAGELRDAIACRGRGASRARGRRTAVTSLRRAVVLRAPAGRGALVQRAREICVASGDAADGDFRCVLGCGRATAGRPEHPIQLPATR